MMKIWICRISLLLLAMSFLLGAVQSDEAAQNDLKAMNPKCSEDTQCNKIYEDVGSTTPDTEKKALRETERYISEYNKTKTDFDELQQWVDSVEGDPDIANSTKLDLKGLRTKIKTESASSTLASRKGVVPNLKSLMEALAKQIADDRNTAEEVRRRVNAIDSELVSTPNPSAHRNKLFELRRELTDAKSSYEKHEAVNRYDEYKKPQTILDYSTAMTTTPAKVTSVTDTTPSYSLKTSTSEKSQPAYGSLSLEPQIAELQSMMDDGSKNIEKMRILEQLQNAQMDDSITTKKAALSAFYSYKEKRNKNELELRSEIQYTNNKIAEKGLSPLIKKQYEDEQMKLKTALQSKDTKGMEETLAQWQRKKESLGEQANNHNDQSERLSASILKAESLRPQSHTTKSSEFERIYDALEEAKRNGDPRTTERAIRKFDEYVKDREHWEAQLRNKISQYREHLVSDDVDSSDQSTIEQQITILTKAIDTESIAGMQNAYHSASDKILLEHIRDSNSDSDYFGFHDLYYWWV